MKFVRRMDLALAGHGAEAVRDAIARAIVTMPEQLRRSLTWDQGAELAQHARLKIDAGRACLLLRSSQPMAARLQREHQRTAATVLSERYRSLAHTVSMTLRPWLLALNTRPRKTLGWKTPAETLDEFLRSEAIHRSVATTG